jgi:hypothetical protein
VLRVRESPKQLAGNPPRELCRNELVKACEGADSRCDVVLLDRAQVSKRVDEHGDDRLHVTTCVGVGQAPDIEPRPVVLDAVRRRVEEALRQGRS